MPQGTVAGKICLELMPISPIYMPDGPQSNHQRTDVINYSLTVTQDMHVWCAIGQKSEMGEIYSSVQNIYFAFTCSYMMSNGYKPAPLDLSDVKL